MARSPLHRFVAPLVNANRVLSCVLAVLAWILAGGALAGEPESRSGAALDEPAQAADEVEGYEVEGYDSAWEYRWGDSPEGARGERRWAAPGDADPAWRPMRSLGTPPDRRGQRFLWLRTRLPAKAMAEPTLYLRGVDLIFEAYLDGALIYRFGDFEGPRALEFRGYKAHYLPLGAGSAGKTLALRIYSDHVNIGLWGQPLIGPHAAITTRVFRSELPQIVMAVILISLGMFMLGLSLARRDQTYSAYGGFALFTGVYYVAMCSFRQFIVDAPLGWIHLEIGVLYVIPIFFIAYFEGLFGRGWLGLAPWMRRANIAYALGAAVAVSTGLVNVLGTLLPFQLFFLVELLYFSVMSVVTSWRGGRDKRIFSAGFCIAALTGVLDVLRALDIVQQNVVTISYYGIFAFTLSLGWIVGRRFLRVHDRLQKYSTVLQMSLASAGVLEPDGRAGIALEEIIRLLKAKRALLFLCAEHDGKLDLRAARGGGRSRGADRASWRADIVEQVRARKRPVIANGRVGSAAPNTVMAAPLLMRDQLLGVVYLESDAHQIFTEDELAILLGLSNQVSIALVATRAVRLEVQSAVQGIRLQQQGALLAAAARMASGDLEAPIEVSESDDLAGLARALEAMRCDVRAKIRMLEAKNAEVSLLNEELRRKIEERSMSLLVAMMGDDRESGPSRLKIGADLGDRYRVISALGEGAMGVVYEVERPADGRRFAAKVLSRRGDRSAVARFAREAQILSKLDHPNLISIFDVDITPSGVLYLIMELASGVTLMRFHSRFGAVPWGLSVLRQIADALTVLHASGIIHRDLKPSNVLVKETEDGTPRVKLVDFGISVLVDQEEPTAQRRSDERTSRPRIREEEDTVELKKPVRRVAELTRTGALVGTPNYMAPELVRGSLYANAPSDIFSLGVIAYELLTGERPFDAPPIFLLAQGMPLEIPAGLSRVDALDRDVAALFERCLQLDPARRPTARTIAAAIADAAAAPPGEALVVRT